MVGLTCFMNSRITPELRMDLILKGPRESSVVVVRAQSFDAWSAIRVKRKVTRYFALSVMLAFLSVDPYPDAIF